ncbi:MAG: pyridoxamine 5'-phosphate oxidase family protein [Sulfitobacter sp.]
MTNEHDQFWDIIAGIPACMVTTEDGAYIRARPMAPFVDKKARTIQFVTDEDSAKIEEMLLDRSICLSFADTKAMQFASVSGTAHISDNEAVIEKLWGSYCDVFFPGGRDSVSVITLDASRAEYWDNDKNKLLLAKEITKAYFGDHGPDLGENAKLEL